MDSQTHTTKPQYEIAAKCNFDEYN